MIITGNIGRDPEQKTTRGGKPYLSFTVAESYGKEDNRTTNWFSVSYFGDEKDMAGLTKGTRVEVQGDLKVALKDGKVYLDMLSSRVKAAPLPPKKEKADQSSPAPNETAPAANTGVRDQYSDMDDDIPF